MKIYEVGGNELAQEFYKSKRKAIDAAKFYGSPEHFYVIEHDIGDRLNLDLVCAVGSGRGFSRKSTIVWGTQ